MQFFEIQSRHRRARGAALGLAVAFCLLGLSVYRAQVAADTAYTLRSEGNRLRSVPVPAPRGRIFDRSGRVLAADSVGRALVLLPSDAASLEDALARLMPVIGLDSAAAAAAMEQHRRAPGRPLIVMDGLSPAQVDAVLARRRSVPEALLVPSPQRVHPWGPAAAQVVGRVPGTGGEPGTGVEARYDRWLTGAPGLEYVELDAAGRVVSGPDRRPWAPPAPGRDLTLTLDAALQRRVHGLWPPGERGTLVALEPATGAVLAMYSAPWHDPAMGAGVPVESEGGALSRLYAPGDVWKPVTAAIALELDVVDPGAYMMIPCRGGMRYGERYFRCWEQRGHGFLDMASAIARSCDVYFYQLGLKIGLARLLEHGSRLGFDAAPGVGLPGARAGVFPDSPGWLAKREGRAPDETAVLSLAAGRGSTRQSALQMARFYGALVTGGRAPVPRLVVDSTDPVAGPYLTLQPDRLSVLGDGLRRVTGPEGAARLSALEHWAWLGQGAPSRSTEGGESWFIGLAGPKDGAAEIVVATVLEVGDVASAARLAAKTADYYLRSKNGMPIDSIQTVGEHLEAGLPVPWATWR